MPMISERVLKTLLMLAAGVKEQVERENEQEAPQRLPQVVDGIIANGERNQWRQMPYQERLEGSAAMTYLYGIPEADANGEYWASWEEVNRECIEALNIFNPNIERAPKAKEEIDFSGELVQIVIALLKHPLPASRLNKATLAKLRKALLSPEELSEIRQQLENAISCIMCGQEIVQRETAGFFTNEAGQHGLACGRCLGHYAKCAHEGCNELVRIPRQYVTCHAHQERDPAPVNADLDGGGAEIFDGLLRHMAVPTVQARRR
jgi:hypothetical protein